MEVRRIPIGKLEKAVYNPRKDLKHEDAEYQKIKKSIEEFGYIQPIIINRDYTIISGHQRLKVLIDLGYDKVECVMMDLDKEQEMALNIAMNKIDGEWDMPKLKDLLEELDNGNFDIELTGFDMKEIESLMTQFHVDDDELPDDLELDKEDGDVDESVGKTLKFGKYKCVLSDDEFENLEEAYLEYVEKNKNGYGFITYLLD